MAITVSREVERETAPRRLSVDDAVRMTEAEILGELERVELVDGRLVEMTQEGRRHLALTVRINGLMWSLYAPHFQVAMQGTLRLHDYGYRQPDVYVTNAPLESRDPLPHEVPLVIEVADTSLDRDLEPKAADYAAFGVADYWVGDVNGRRLIVHTRPGPTGYASVESLSVSDRIILPRLGIEIDVLDLLPRVTAPEDPDRLSEG